METRRRGAGDEGTQIVTVQATPLLSSSAPSSKIFMLPLFKKHIALCIVFIIT